MLTHVHVSGLPPRLGGLRLSMVSRLGKVGFTPCCWELSLVVLAVSRNENFAFPRNEACVHPARRWQPRGAAEISARDTLCGLT